jgi:hypothetical protein
MIIMITNSQVFTLQQQPMPDYWQKHEPHALLYVTMETCRLPSSSLALSNLNKAR